MTTRHPDVVVELPDGADAAAITTTVAGALRRAGHPADADEFERHAASSDLPTLTRTAREWVVIAWIRQTVTPIPGGSTAWVSPMPGAPRWQYAVVNTGSINSSSRMSEVLGTAGQAGWELVAAYDKASNWINGIEKGFLLLKRPVPADVTPPQWAFEVRA